MIVVGERLAAVPGGLTAAVRAATATGARLVWIPRRAGERGAVEAGALPVAAARRPPGHRPAGPGRGRGRLGRRRTPAPLRPRHRPDRRGRGHRRTGRAASSPASRSPTCRTRHAPVEALDRGRLPRLAGAAAQRGHRAGRRGLPGRRGRREGRHLPQLGGQGAAVRGRAQARADDADAAPRRTRGSCTCWPTRWTSTSRCRMCSPYAVSWTGSAAGTGRAPPTRRSRRSRCPGPATGEAVLAGHRLLLDQGRLQEGDDALAGTRHAARRPALRRHRRRDGRQGRRPAGRHRPVRQRSNSRCRSPRCPTGWSGCR